MARTSTPIKRAADRAGTTGPVFVGARMNPVQQALWFVESHFAEPITLEDVAEAGGVSRHHMTRAFGAAFGASPMRYVRGRRLSEAARRLACGAPDILSVALDAGYDSHEAFTRAFRDQFGATPEQVRAAACLDHLKLVEPIKMNEDINPNLPPPRFEDGQTLLIAGLGARYDNQTMAGIPAQWQRFAPHLGHIPGQQGPATYGVVCNGDGEGNIDYIAGVAVADFQDLPADFARIRIPACRYAVFTHAGHISTIRQTWNTIWGQWLPGSGLEAADAPDFERYGESFDPQTGAGGFEIWLPVKD
jgi:AraC family transcriptional regulator